MCVDGPLLHQDRSVQVLSWTMAEKNSLEFTDVLKLVVSVGEGGALLHINCPEEIIRVVEHLLLQLDLMKAIHYF